MNSCTQRLSVLTCCLVLITGPVFAAEQAQERSEVVEQTQAQIQIYGSQLMTKKERLEYRAKMRAATSAEERERIRQEHHEMMKKRAAEQGVTLPDEPPLRKGGMGAGPQGMGPKGGGAGPGRNSQ